VDLCTLAGLRGIHYDDMTEYSMPNYCFSLQVIIDFLFSDDKPLIQITGRSPKVMFVPFLSKSLFKTDICAELYLNMGRGLS
jgi:hypothetical protein